MIVGDRSAAAEPFGVYCDSRVASREAVEHLASLGHRKIVMRVNIVDDSDQRDRLAGYRDAHLDHRQKIDEKLIIRTSGDLEGGSQLIRRVAIVMDRPTPIYITDPMAAVGAMCESQAMGLSAPGDMSIISFDDSYLRHTVLPKMTAVCQDANALGPEVYGALSERLTYGHVIDSKPPPAWLEVHGSVGPVSGTRSGCHTRLARLGLDGVADTFDL